MSRGRLTMREKRNNSGGIVSTSTESRTVQRSWCNVGRGRRTARIDGASGRGGRRRSGIGRRGRAASVEDAAAKERRYVVVERAHHQVIRVGCVT